MGVGVVPKGGEQPDVYPQQGHVVGDIPPHAPQADAHRPGVGVRAHQRGGGHAADVHIYPAHHHGIGGGGDDIPLAGDVALFHQIGYVHRHRGPGDARLVRQLLLGDQGVLLNPSEDLALPLGHGPHS